MQFGHVVVAPYPISGKPPFWFFFFPTAAQNVLRERFQLSLDYPLPSHSRQAPVQDDTFLSAVDPKEEVPQVGPPSLFFYCTSGEIFCPSARPDVKVSLRFLFSGGPRLPSLPPEDGRRPPPFTPSGRRGFFGRQSPPLLPSGAVTKTQPDSLRCLTSPCTTPRTFLSGLREARLRGSPFCPSTREVSFPIPLLIHSILVRKLCVFPFSRCSSGGARRVFYPRSWRKSCPLPPFDCRGFPPP